MCKCDFTLAVELEAVVVLQAQHGLSRADITDNARFLIPVHLVPPLEQLKLGRGKFEICALQPPSLLIRCNTGGGKTVYAKDLV